MITPQEALERDTDHLVEVIDKDNRPLAVLSKRSVHRQLLMHRSVQVLVFNPDKKIFLQKRNLNKPFFPGRWDVSARTHPRAGESDFDAAIRALREELNLEIEQPQLIRELPAGPETGFEHVSLFEVTRNTLPVVPNGDAVCEGFYYSPEELTCLVKEFRELLTPNLVILWESGLLVPA
ncbi:NUDIX hydrolase [Pseudodesulfovibrio mercurii]|uniref:NUDIX hydrolase n=1 Tax=Pseudodesulfovibrio mercurii TaxID=641491 RepID=F0JFA7_9BACT|nr:NUDIX domain-containing protein [Pseudodesulfovibrio mercurii]EGB13663.1 NUDIX hydrolase [Pseudodesulfovibrio mercurii]